MSAGQFKNFLDAVATNSELQGKLKAAANPDAVVAIAKAAGFTISADDITQAHSVAEDELSDDEMMNAAGGFAKVNLPGPTNLAVNGGIAPPSNEQVKAFKQFINSIG